MESPSFVHKYIYLVPSGRKIKNILIAHSHRLGSDVMCGKAPLYRFIKNNKTRRSEHLG